jgi:hypothetical protein
MGEEEVVACRLLGLGSDRTVEEEAVEAVVEEEVLQMAGPFLNEMDRLEAAAVVVVVETTWSTVVGVVHRSDALSINFSVGVAGRQFPPNSRFQGNTRGPPCGQSLAGSPEQLITMSTR